MSKINKKEDQQSTVDCLDYNRCFGDLDIDPNVVFKDSWAFGTNPIGRLINLTVPLPPTQFQGAIGRIKSQKHKAVGRPTKISALSICTQLQIIRD